MADGCFFIYKFLFVVSLHHDVHDSAGYDDHFLRGVAGEVTGGVFVSKNELLHFVLRRVFRALQGETYLAVELHWVLLRIFNQIGFVQFGPLGVDDE